VITQIVATAKLYQPRLRRLQKITIAMISEATLKPVQSIRPMFIVRCSLSLRTAAAGDAANRTAVAA
jgi:hypothetical protein